MRAALAVLSILAASLCVIAATAWLLGGPSRPAVTFGALAIGLAACAEVA